MVAAKTSAMDPVPSPISSPQVSRICQDSVTSTVRALPAADQHQRHGGDRADAEAFHQGGGEGRGEAEEHQVDADRGREHGGGPAEFALQRHHQHPRRGAEAGGADEREEGDGGDDPGRVDPAAWERAAGWFRGRSCGGSVPWVGGAAGAGARRRRGARGPGFG